VIERSLPRVTGEELALPERVMPATSRFTPHGGRMELSLATAASGVGVLGAQATGVAELAEVTTAQAALGAAVFAGHGAIGFLRARDHLIDRLRFARALPAGIEVMPRFSSRGLTAASALRRHASSAAAVFGVPLVLALIDGESENHWMLVCVALVLGRAVRNVALAATVRAHEREHGQWLLAAFPDDDEDDEDHAGDEDRDDEGYEDYGPRKDDQADEGHDEEEDEDDDEEAPPGDPGPLFCLPR